MASVTTNFLTETADTPAVRQTHVARALSYLESEIERVDHQALRLMEATADVRLGAVNVPMSDCKESRPPSTVALADRLDTLGDRIGAIADFLCEATNRTEL